MQKRMEIQRGPLYIKTVFALAAQKQCTDQCVVLSSLVHPVVFAGILSGGILSTLKVTQKILARR